MIPRDIAPVLFFDGECNLCNNAVQFILKRDKKKIFFFAALQSAAGKEAIEKVGIDALETTGSFILYYNGAYFTRSSAALHTFRLLGGLWPLLYVGIIVPRILRDSVYNIVSRNRYKWFGRRDSCMVPTPDIMARFLS